MALISCKECGHEISDRAITCPKCGISLKEETNNTVITEIPVNTLNDKGKKKTFLWIGVSVGIFIILAVIAILMNQEDKIYCTSYLSNNVGWYDLNITYTFDDNVVSKIEGQQSIYLTSASGREELWNASNKDQDQYNHYDGMTYHAKLSEDGVVILDYSLEIQKAPKMFEVLQTVSNVKGLNEYSTKEEVIRKYESQGFTCEG